MILVGFNSRSELLYYVDCSFCKFMVVDKCLNLYLKPAVDLKSLVWVRKRRVVKKKFIKRDPVCQTAIFVLSICRKSRKATIETDMSEYCCWPSGRKRMSQMSSVTYFYLILDCGQLRVWRKWQQVEVSVRRQLFVPSECLWTSFSSISVLPSFADSPSS